MLRLHLRTPDGSRLPVLCGPGAVDSLPTLWHRAWRTAALIGDRHVMRLHGPRVIRLLRRCAPVVHSYAIPAGERHKTRRTKQLLEDRLLADRPDRNTCIVALGGGVTLDLAGFVAATFLRGVPHIVLPTTLLAQIDAALGGKTGVNTPAGKNLIGAFHFPRAVVVDPHFLRTLPPAEWRNGLAEAVKHAVVGDRELFRRLERDAVRLRRPGGIDAPTLRRCLAVKLRVVAADPFERGMRSVLNFGHTVGHAVEAAVKHRVAHGAAVALGMVVEADLAVECCGFPPAERDRLVRLLRRLGLPAAPRLPFARLVPFLAVDKKNRAGAIRLALPRRIGEMAGTRGSWTVPVPLAAIAEAWRRHAAEPLR